MNIQIVPESAPFTSEQRAWLNGFLAGMIGVVNCQDSLGQNSLGIAQSSADSKVAQGGDSGSMAAAAAILNPPLGPSSPPMVADSASAIKNDSEEMPWHDASLPIADRMKLAEGKPKERRLMAAMAQLNCGSCGYLCQTYAEAIASGNEKSLSLCSPGGNETAKMLKQLKKEFASTPTKTAEGSPIPATQDIVMVSPVGTRDNPAIAKLIRSQKLNRDGSAKDTRHVEIDLTGTGVTYNVGDALGVVPTNCQSLVNDVINSSKIERDPGIAETLLNKCLRSIPSELVELAITKVKQRVKFNGAVTSDAELVKQLEVFLDGDEIDQWDVLEFFEAFPDLRLTASELLETLPVIRPRLYSIASSQSLYTDAVHLTVGRVENTVRERKRKGVASTLFSDRLSPGNPVKVFVHKSHGFTIPKSSQAPMIMVGPGTGIAPFMAFLQQREADRATGDNWLFFGDQKRSCDYLYQEQLESWKHTGLLKRLDLAFSRDSADKVYVQHLMMKNGEELFKWLELGAYFFVCGDASRMAVDVDLALKQVIASMSGRGPDFAKHYVAKMTDEKRYLRDVY